MRLVATVFFVIMTCPYAEPQMQLPKTLTDVTAALTSKGALEIKTSILTVIKQISKDVGASNATTVKPPTTVTPTKDTGSALRASLLEAIKNVQAANSRTKEGDSFTQSNKVSENSISAQKKGDILQEASRILVKERGAKVLAELKNVNAEAVLESILAESGIKLRAKRAADCGLVDKECDYGYPYRTHTGRCNSIEVEDQGAAGSTLRRVMGEAEYEDGLGAVKSLSATGQRLPSARVVSNRIFAEAAIPSYDTQYSYFLQQVGQFVSHDIVGLPFATGSYGSSLDCSQCDSGAVTDNCAPIEVPANDPYFTVASNPVRCMRMTRIINGQKGLGQRTPISEVTAYLDISTVYGSSECANRELRTLQGGQMKILERNGLTLPPHKNVTPPICQSAPFGYPCFQCGDARNSLNPGLVPLHVLFLRLHNKYAGEIARIRPRWTDETIYQETRRLLIAIYQNVVYNEFVPRIIGNSTTASFNLRASSIRKTFDRFADPSITVEFAGAAYRYGHSQVRKDIPQATPANGTIGAYIDLGKSTFYTDMLYDRSAGVYAMQNGHLNYPSMAVDRQFSFPIRNQLFEIRGRPGTGIDLAAINIQRGRELGLQSYNAFRVRLGMPKLNSFADLRTAMTPENADLVQGTYASVDDIDLYTGILLENRNDTTSLLGPVGSFLIAEQFASLRAGDRYFYESNSNRGSLSTAEYNAVRSYSLAHLLCDSMEGATTMPSSPFLFKSPRVNCATFAPINLSAILID